KPYEVRSPVAGPSLQEVGPFGRYGRGPPTPAEETPGDGRHRVGVVADPHRGPDPDHQVGAGASTGRDSRLGDGGVRSLKSRDDEAVGNERAWWQPLGLLQPRGPLL